MHAIDKQPVELSDVELATIHGGGLWSWIKKKVLIPIGNLMPWNQRPSGGDIVPAMQDPSYRPPEVRIRGIGPEYR